MRNFTEDQRICDAATAGPWILYVSHGDDEAQVFEATNTYPIATFGFTNEDEDARFIAEARTGWPAALERIRVQDAEIEELRNIIRDINALLNSGHIVSRKMSIAVDDTLRRAREATK